MNTSDHPPSFIIMPVENMCNNPIPGGWGVWKHPIPGVCNFAICAIFSKWRSRVAELLWQDGHESFHFHTAGDTF